MSSIPVGRRWRRDRGPGIAIASALATGACLAAIGIGSLGCPAGTPGKGPRAAAPPPPSVRKLASPPTQEVGWLTIGRDPPPSSLMAVKPENLATHVRSLYRLRPDRRFLYAAAELDWLTRGGPRQGTLSVRFEESRWLVSLDGSSIGSLPPFASFADAKSFLLSRLEKSKVAKSGPGVEAWEAADADALENGEEADLFPALARLDEAWAASPGDPAVTQRALRGLLWLSLQTFDALERSDPILGKALALLVLAERNRPGSVAQEECLLASLLGYEDEGRLLAKNLPAGDPVRLFADWDLTGLAVLADQPDPKPRTEYLYLLRLAESRKNDETLLARFRASSWARRSGVPTLRLLLTRDPFSMRTEPALAMEIRILMDVSAAAGTAEKGEPAHPEALSSALEAAVDKEASRRNGSILDRSVLRAYYLGNFYSSLFVQARYFFDRFGSTEDAERLGNSIADPPPGTATELKDWILHRAHLRRSVEGVVAVAADLSRLTHIGVGPLDWSVYSVANSSSAGGFRSHRAPIPGFFDHLDSRPSNLFAAAHAARDLLKDPAIYEDCVRVATKRAPHEFGSDLPWALGFLGDAPRLEAIANDKSWRASIRASAIEELALREKGDSKLQLDRLRDLIREEPGESGVLRSAVALLEKRNEIDTALRLVNDWLKQHFNRDLDWAGISSMKSRLLRKQGKFREAWKVAQPAAETWKQECLEEATLTLIDLGRLDDGLAMARKSLERYGDADDAAHVAQILWMKGRDDEASEVLTSPDRAISAGEWNSSLPEAFVHAFQKSDEARAEAAFLKLAVPSVPALNLIWFLEHLTNNGRPELALKLGNHLLGRGPAGWATVAIYHATVKARGPAAARQWLRANATPRELDVMGKQALQDHDFDMVWDLPDHPDPTKNEILNMIRAAALLYGSGDSEERRAALIRFFESRPRKEFVVYGLFLLGRADRSELFALVKDPSYICSIGWILGLTSAHEGRYEDANAWLQVSVQAGAEVPPLFWASSILGRWAAERCTLAEAERKKII